MPQPMETWMPATLPDIDMVCQCLREFLLRLGLESRFFEVSLVAREALVNAVMHGCGCEPQQKVRFFLRIDNETLVMEIEDPGEGFDWRKQMNVQAALTDIKGRGLSIFKHYCKHYEYNDKGNIIRLFQTIAR
jgi:serine/threonine-protein kinase RsbW